MYKVKLPQGALKVTPASQKKRQFISSAKYPFLSIIFDRRIIEPMIPRASARPYSRSMRQNRTEDYAAPQNAEFQAVRKR
jgi:hypothetical protein